MPDQPHTREAGNEWASRPGGPAAGEHRRLRVAVVHNLLPGGARRRLSATVARLPADIVEFTLNPDAAVTGQPVVVEHTERAPAAARWARPMLRYQDLAVLLERWELLAAAVRDWEPDVVFANPCHLVQTPPAMDRFGAPAVYFCDEPRRATHDPAAIAATRRLTRPLYARLRARLAAADRRGVLGAAAVLTNSGDTARRIEAAYGVTAQVVPLGVEPVFRPALRGPAHRPTGLPQHLLSVGTLIPGKGHDLVLRAAAASSVDLPVLIVAPRPAPAERHRLAVLADRLGVPLRVRIGVTDQQLRDAYQQALATLYLARAEPLGLASLESQACGTPVVVADEGGLPDTVTHGATGFVVPRTVAAAAAALDHLARPEVRMAMSRAAAARPVPTWTATAQAVHAELARHAHPAVPHPSPPPDDRPPEGRLPEDRLLEDRVLGPVAGPARQLPGGSPRGRA